MSLPISQMTPEQIERKRVSDRNAYRTKVGIPFNVPLFESVRIAENLAEPAPRSFVT